MDGRCGEVLCVDSSEIDGEMEEEEEEEEEDAFTNLHEGFVRSKGALKEKAGSWKTGRWSVQELRQLKKNIQAFMKENQVKDIAAFVFGSERGNRDNFYHYISKGINRPVFNVYRKASIVLNEDNYVGKWTPELERELERLHSIHGNKWTTIGRALGVTAQAARDKFRRMASRSKNKGGWSVQEERRLRDAVGREVGEELPSSLSWEVVASAVRTRSAVQCRTKWVNSLSGQCEVKSHWSVPDSLRLLRELGSLEAEDEEGVQWAELARGWPVARNGYFLRQKWAALRRDVPSYRLKTFQENIDYLLCNKAPALEQHLRKEEQTSSTSCS